MSEKGNDIMKLIDLLGPMNPKTIVNIFIDVERDKYGNPTEALYEGVAGAVPALLTKLKVTGINVSYEPEDIKENPPVLVIDGIFTNEDDSNQYQALTV